jgi:nucleoside-diphosphate-sugar epimerase
VKILLTGASGFVARACQAELRRRGHVVATADRRGPVEYSGDLAQPAFCATLPEVDAIVHAAAVQYVSADLPWVRRQAYFHRNNVEATRLLCARYAGSSAHFVNIGTSMMYEQNGSVVYRIGDPLKGQGVYSRSKLAAQAHVDALPNARATIIPCIVGGLGREGLFRPMVSLIRRRRLAVFPGSGRHKTAMVHVEDLAELIARVVEGRLTGWFNAAAPEPLCIHEWIDEIARELGLAHVARLALPLAPIHALSALTGFRLLAREQLLMLAQPHVLGIDESLALGWRPRYDNAQIVRAIARHIASSAP